MKKTGSESIEQTAPTDDRPVKSLNLTAILHSKFHLVVYLGCAFSIIIVLMIGALSLYYLNQQADMNRWVGRNYRIIERISYIRSRLNDIVINRNDHANWLFGTYNRSQDSLFDELTTLDTIIRDDPQQAKRMILLRSQIDELFTLWQNGDAAAGSSSDELYRQIVRNDQKLASIRRTLMTINDAEQQLLQQRQAQNRDLIQKIKRTSILATLTILLIVIGLVVLIISELKYRKKTLEKEREISKLKSSFVSLASHEFRTPLSSILLSVNLIRRYVEKGDTENILRHGDKIEGAVKNLITILEDFLSLEKLDAGKVEPAFKPFQLKALCEGVLNDMLLISKPGQHLAYEHTGPDEKVLLDEHLIRNAVVNLLSNAIKYAGDSAVIFLRTQIKQGKTTITVGDNGIGIPEKELKNLCKPFFRVNENGNIPGTGLGLNIVMRYVQLMKGTLTMTSVPGKETLFVMSFDAQPEIVI